MALPTPSRGCLSGAGTRRRGDDLGHDLIGLVDPRGPIEDSGRGLGKCLGPTFLYWVNYAAHAVDHPEVGLSSSSVRREPATGLWRVTDWRLRLTNKWTMVNLRSVSRHFLRDAGSEFGSRVFGEGFGRMMRLPTVRRSALFQTQPFVIHLPHRRAPHGIGGHYPFYQDNTQIWLFLGGESCPSLERHPVPSTGGRDFSDSPACTPQQKRRRSARAGSTRNDSPPAASFGRVRRLLVPSAAAEV